MKRNVIGLLIIAAAVASNADDLLPKRPDFGRYAAMLERSPFAVATAVAAPLATPDFARDLYVANAAHTADEDVVTIASTSDKNFKKYPSTKTPDDGYAITNIEWSDKIGQTKVTISKDGNYATLTFNQALISQPMQNTGQPLVNAVPQPQQNFIKPAPVPMVPNAVPTPVLPNQPGQGRVYNRGMIQRNPVTPAPTPIVAPTPELDDMDDSE